MKLGYDDLLSSFAFKFNLRRHTVVYLPPTGTAAAAARVMTPENWTALSADLSGGGGQREVRLHMPRFNVEFGAVDLSGALRAMGLGAAVQVDPIKPKLKASTSKRLKLRCDYMLSSFAFKFNLRRYT